MGNDEKNSRSRPTKRARGIKSDTSERQDQDFDEFGGEESVTNQNISDRLQKAKIKAQSMRHVTDGKRSQTPNRGKDSNAPTQNAFDKLQKTTSQTLTTKHISRQEGDNDTMMQ